MLRESTKYIETRTFFQRVINLYKGTAASEPWNTVEKLQYNQEVWLYQN